MATISGNPNQKLTGINPLAYMGVEATTPPQMILANVPPVPGDAVGFELGTFWLVTNPQELWVLTNLFKGVATWVQLYPAGAAMITFITDAGMAAPVLGVLNVIGGTQINTSGAGNTITINLDGTVVTDLTGNTGGPVPALAGNINVVGNTSVGLTVTGTPLTNTLTITTTGGHPVGETVTGNSGGAVPFTALGNINVVGDGTTVNVVGNPGTNTLTISATNTGDLRTLTGDTGGAVTPSSNNINVITDVAAIHSGSSISFSGSGSTLTLNTTDSLTNVIIGNGAGNATLSGSVNTGLGGDGVLSHLTTGGSNTSIGSNSCFSLTTGDTNTIVGSVGLNAATSSTQNSGLGANVLQNILTGTNNLALGYAAAFAYVGAESSNIIIGNDGVAAESNVIRIGTQGSGTGQQNKAFMAGIVGNTVTNLNYVTINTSTGQLGATAVSPSGLSDIFLARQSATATNVTGDGTVYSLGQATVLSVITDTGSNLYIGNGAGAAATFTAPATGNYFLQFQALVVGGSATKSFQPYIAIVTTSSTYGSNFDNTSSFNDASGTSSGNPSVTISVVAPMSMGDTARFAVMTNVGGTKVCSVADNGTANMCTFISGYRVS